MLAFLKSASLISCFILDFVLFKTYFIIYRKCESTKKELPTRTVPVWKSVLIYSDRYCSCSLIIFSDGVSKVGLERSINAEMVVHNCRSSSMSLSSFLLWATLLKEYSLNIVWSKYSWKHWSIDPDFQGYGLLVPVRASRTPNEMAGAVFKVRRWCILWSLSVWVDEWQSSTLPKTRKSRLNVFWLLSVGLHGLGVHFCLGLHNVGKKKL